MGGQRRQEAWRGATPNTASDRALDLALELIDRFARRRGPMPVVVLHPVEADSTGRQGEAVRAIVPLLHQTQVRRRVLCAYEDPVPDPDPALRPEDRSYAAATALVRRLAADEAWENRERSQYRPYRFPRAELLAAVDQAVAEVRAGAGEPDPQAVVARLRQLRWIADGGPRGGELAQKVRAVMQPASLAGAILVAVLGGLAQDKSAAQVVLEILAGCLLLLGAGGLLVQWTRARRLAPGFRWIATTTFLSASGTAAPVWSFWRPKNSRTTVEDRAREAARQLLLADGPESQERDLARQYCLQLRTLALLEDFRDSHRMAWDARHLKRTVPPLVFVPRATEANGALPLLRAISDVRSRRSEQDPLLLITSVGYEDRGLLQAGAPAPFPAPSQEAQEPDELYEAWVRNRLRTGQSPSLGGALPWILPVALAPELLQARNHDHLRSTDRVAPSWWRLWSRRTAAVAVVLATLAGGMAFRELTDRYCGSPGINRDLRQLGGECIGVAAEGAELPTRAGDMTLDGGTGGPGQGIGLHQLQSWIADLNDKVEQDHARRNTPYITVVFAGALSTQSDQQFEGLDALRQLAGVHTAQHYFDRSTSSLEMKVLIANGGQRMRYQTVMAQRIADLARRDRTIVGVVGMGIDGGDADQAIGVLQQAGLAVADTTNSDNLLADHHLNYLGLAATNKEEAAALQQLLPRGTGGPALVLARGSTDDPYSNQQADSAMAALRAAGYTPRQLPYTVNGDAADFEPIRADMCAPDVTVLYLAGRSTDLDGLVDKLNSCAGRELTILSGDDMTRQQFARSGLTGVTLPNGVTLYYPALAVPQAVGQSLLNDASGLLYDHGTAATPADPLYKDGVLALAFNATLVLQDAASYARGHGGDDAAAVQTALQHNNPDPGRNHVLELFGVAAAGTQGATALCGGQVGGTDQPPRWDCARPK